MVAIAIQFIYINYLMNKLQYSGHAHAHIYDPDMRGYDDDVDDDV